MFCYAMWRQVCKDRSAGVDPDFEKSERKNRYVRDSESGINELPTKKLFSKPQYRRFWEYVARLEWGELGQATRFPGWLAAATKNPTISIVGSAGI